MNEDLATKWRRLTLEQRTVVFIGLMGIVAILLFGIGFKMGFANAIGQVTYVMDTCICPVLTRY